MRDIKDYIKWAQETAYRYRRGSPMPEDAGERLEELAELLKRNADAISSGRFERKMVRAYDILIVTAQCGFVVALCVGSFIGGCIVMFFASITPIEF